MILKIFHGKLFFDCRFVVECVIVSIFTVEYVLRLLAYSSTREHMIHFIFCKFF